ncbi:tyrosinase family protein [Streptomyces sp. NPDC020965]|uniref:tyrosinase family protein n=1 Tax=Streptomyces sp. NPDC020965 TaxID=3365105 RepID=UPI00379DF1AD
MAPPGMSLPTRAELNTVLSVTPYDTALWDYTAPGFRSNLEGGAGPGPHNGVHNWVGGQMLQSVSPNDPGFWLHHSSWTRSGRTGSGDTAGTPICPP